MASPSSQKTREWLPGRGNNCSWEEAWRAQRPLLCSWPGTHLFPGLWLWPPVSQGFDPLKSQSSKGRRQDHQSSYASGCLTVCSFLAVPLQPVVRKQSPTRVTSDPPTFTSKLHHVCLLWHRLYGGRNPFNRGSWEGLWLLGVTGKVYLAHRTRRRRVLGAAATAGETEGWGRVLPATQMCHFLQGSRQDELTRICPLCSRQTPGVSGTGQDSPELAPRCSSKSLQARTRSPARTV